MRDEMLNKYLPDDIQKEVEDIIQKHKEFTAPRQVLAMHYIFEYLQVRSPEKSSLIDPTKGISWTEQARFIELLTQRHQKTIYDLIRSPFATKKGNFRKEDLQFIRPFFENLGLTEIVKMINNQLQVDENQ